MRIKKENTLEDDNKTKKNILKMTTHRWGHLVDIDHLHCRYEQPSPLLPYPKHRHYDDDHHHQRHNCKCSKQQTDSV